MKNNSDILDFYNVDSLYADYLRQYDSLIPYIEYKDRCLYGVVLTINNIKYFVPVFSNKNKYFSSFLIYNVKSKDKNVPVSSLRFSFMFPCHDENLSPKILNQEPDYRYRNLTQIEYNYCNKHAEQIRAQANKIYKLANKPELRKKYNICNFQLLEEKYLEWNKSMSD